VLDCNSNTDKCQSLLVRNEHLLDALINKNVNTILDEQQTVLKQLGNVLTGLGNLQIKVGDVQTACAPPDLVPVALPGSVPPNVFCQVDSNGNLVVRVKNQGLTNAPASTLRVTFSTPTGSMPVDIPTPALAGGGGFVDLTTPVPANCYLSADRGCHFQIAVDVADVVVEGDETNNNVSGVCSPVL